MAKHSSGGNALSPLRFAQDLVRRSHSIKARLRRGDTTHDFLVRMRDAALHKPDDSSPLVAPAEDADQRHSTTAQFLTETGDKLQENVGALRKQIEALEAKCKSTRARAIDDIVEFLVVVWGDGDVAACQATLKKFRPLLLELGVTEVDILKETRAAAAHT